MAAPRRLAVNILPMDPNRRYNDGTTTMLSSVELAKPNRMTTAMGA